MSNKLIPASIWFEETISTDVWVAAPALPPDVRTDIVKSSHKLFITQFRETK